MTDQTPYTPSLDEAREAFSEMSGWDLSADAADAAFDRFIAQVRAEAWDEGATAASEGYDLPDAAQIHNPYRTRGAVR